LGISFPEESPVKRFLLALAALGMAFEGLEQARAGPVTVDEFGNSAVLGPGHIGNDPGPGGLKGVLIYDLPVGGFQGDVIITEPGGGPFSDLVRFNGNFTLIFYSDASPNEVEGKADGPFPGVSPEHFTRIK
jgi:hypothetical protein